MSDSQRPEDPDSHGAASVPPPPVPPAPPVPPVPPMPAAPTEVMPAFAPVQQPARQTPQPDPKPAGARKRRGRGWLIGGGVTVVALAILGVGGWFAYNWLLDTRFSPEAAAEAYYDQITSGDVDDALKQWDPAEADEPAMAATGGAFELARAGGSEIEMGDPDTYGHRSSIEATFTVDGLEYRQNISMRYSEHEWLIFPKWTVDEIESSYTADAIATEYLQHLVDGEATAAIAMLPTEPEGSTVLINDDVYAAAEARPESFEITGTDAEGVAGSVSATFTMGGKQYDTDLEFTSEVEVDDGYGVWVLTNAPIERVVLWNVANVTTVNGVDVDLTPVTCGACDARSLIEAATTHASSAVALPGTYVFAAPESAGAITYGDDQVLTVAPGETKVTPSRYDADWVSETYGYGDDATVGLLQGVVSFDARLGDEARQQAVDAVWKQIDLCMESDQFEPANCPNTLEYRDPGYYAVSDIVRSWNEKPDVHYDEASGSVVVSGGVMKVDYTWRFFEDDEWEPDTESVYLPFGYSDLYLNVTSDDAGKVSVDLGQL